MVPPILEAIPSLESGIHDPDHQAVVQAASLRTDTVAKELPALIRGEYVTASNQHDLANIYFADLRLLERAKRHVDQWPSEEAIYEQLLETLDRLMAASEQADKPKIGQ